ncbi:hypothetical protein J7K74_01050, partial [Candidatus Woesearchaeota archaeon]|nr:hypothetical protein [Candidatus Woesearchaeota archaeon]
MNRKGMTSLVVIITSILFLLVAIVIFAEIKGRASPLVMVNTCKAQIAAAIMNPAQNFFPIKACEGIFPASITIDEQDGDRALKRLAYLIYLVSDLAPTEEYKDALLQYTPIFKLERDNEKKTCSQIFLVTIDKDYKVRKTNDDGKSEEVLLNCEILREYLDEEGFQSIEDKASGVIYSHLEKIHNNG